MALRHISVTDVLVLSVTDVFVSRPLSLVEGSIVEGS